jgi:hypothetical protein
VPCLFRPIVLINNEHKCRVLLFIIIVFYCYDAALLPYSKTSMLIIVSGYLYHKVI